MSHAAWFAVHSEMFFFCTPEALGFPGLKVYTLRMIC